MNNGKFHMFFADHFGKLPLLKSVKVLPESKIVSWATDCRCWVSIMLLSEVLLLVMVVLVLTKTKQRITIMLMEMKMPA